MPEAIRTNEKKVHLSETHADTAQQQQQVLTVMQPSSIDKRLIFRWGTGDTVMAGVGTNRWFSRAQQQQFRQIDATYMVRCLIFNVWV